MAHACEVNQPTPELSWVNGDGPKMGEVRWVWAGLAKGRPRNAAMAPMHSRGYNNRHRDCAGGYKSGRCAKKKRAAPQAGVVLPAAAGPPARIEKGGLGGWGSLFQSHDCKHSWGLWSRA